MSTVSPTLESQIMVEERRRRLLDLYRSGVTNQQELARVFGVTTRTIRRDLGAIHARLIAENNATAKNVYIAHQLDRINFLIREAIMGWRDSRKPAEMVVERTQTIPGKNGGPPQTKTNRETRVQPQSGNPAFIEKITQLLQREAKLLGLDALESAQKRQADATAATSIMEMIRQAEMQLETELVEGPPLVLEGPPSTAAADEADDQSIIVDIPLVPSGNGDGEAEPESEVQEWTG